MKTMSEVISDEEIDRVHGNSNFGSRTNREVVNEGVYKVMLGYSTGHTQYCILREHKLITKEKYGTWESNLTKKGKYYARAMANEDKIILC